MIMTKKRDITGRSFRGVSYEERLAREVVVGALYRTHTRREVAAMLGLTSGTVGTIVRRLRLWHDDDTLERITAMKRANFAKTKTAEAQRKAGETRKRIYRSELRQVLQGLPQRTNMKVSVRPQKMIMAMTNLRNKYGYLPDPDDDETLLYDENTRRRLPGTPGLYFADEAYYSRKLHIKFKPLEQDMSGNGSER